MPYIQTRTNCKIDKEKEKKIKERLGEAIRILGKTEDWLMVEFVPECNLYFRGSNENLMAYVDVKILGKSTEYNSMTGAITEMLNTELGIRPDHIYVSYGEFANWGWNGSNF